MTSRRIAVLGAGAAGLANARYLLDQGHDVTIFEIGTRIGGLWAYDNDSGRSSAYRSLHINTSKPTTQFADFPFPKDAATFPSHFEMEAYLNAYADHFDLRRRIRFQSEVTTVEPIPSGDPATGIRWSVETVGGRVEEFDAVVVATGHLSDPNMPEAVAGFEGELIHAHYYKEPWDYRGKRVLVMGTGNSGLDITADLCTVADRTVLAARSPELITPKFVMGIPLGRIEAPFRKPWMPKDLHQIVRRICTRLVHGRMEQWGFRTPDKPTHPISHATLINHIAYRRAHVKPGVVGVEGTRVTFADGSSEEFDAIIAATGYRMRFSFLREDIVSEQPDGTLGLFGRAVPLRWPGLYFAGYFNANALSNLRVYEYQARWFAALEAGEVLLPSQEEMQRSIAEDKAYIARRYPGGLRYAHELESFPYITFLKREEKASPRRRARGAIRDRQVVLANRSAEPRMPDHAAASTS
jgi:dimethylaniline monooxygenase (N-oxide forming)